MSCAVFKLFRVCLALKRETDGSPQPLFYCLPYEREQKVHKCIPAKYFRVSSLKISNVVTKETSQMQALWHCGTVACTAGTVALTETANKFSQSLRGLIHRCRI